MTRKRMVRGLPLVALFILVASGLAACAGGSHNGSLTYSVTAHKGGITATVADNRNGKHTVWVVLLNPPKGRHREWFASHNFDSGDSGSASARGPLPAGTYAYAIYDTSGIVYSGGAKYWTPQNRVASGTVTVP